MSITRRSFLERTGTTALILGFPFLAREGNPRADGRAILKEALERMRRNRSYGVALLVPSRPQERKALGRALERLVASRDYEVQELLLEAIYLCVPASLVEAKPDETALLLDPDGKRVAGARLDSETLGTRTWTVPVFEYAPGENAPKGCRRAPGGSESGFPVKFEEGLRDLLRGEGRLEARAKEATTPEVEAAIRDVETPNPADPQALNRAYAFLAANFEKHAAAIVAARLRKEASGCPSALRDFALQRIAGIFYQQAPTDLPFGVAWERIERPDPCPACGMAFPSPPSRKFLRFLAE